MSKPKPQWLGTDDRYARVRRIETLDPAVDDREITELFYSDFRAIAILQGVTGNLMTFAVPRMSRILSSTGQFENHTAKRYVDTALLVSSVMKHGLGPGEGRDAARRVNSMHRQYDIHSDDFIAVGCDVPLMSLEIADRFGWRPVSDAEREALRIHYSKEARAFGSHQPLPGTLVEMREFWEQYLDEQTAFEPQNKKLTDAFLTFLPTLLPKAIRPLAKPILTAQVDPRILRACGLPVPSKARKEISTALMRVLGKSDPLPDSAANAPSPLSTFAQRLYPQGYTVNSLGTHLPKDTESSESLTAD